MHTCPLRGLRFLAATVTLLLAVQAAVANDNDRTGMGDEANIDAGNWPQWRGPRGDGVSRATDLPVTWSGESGVEWKCKLPEWGDSTPAIWDDAVFVTSQLEDGRLVLLRIDKHSGQLEWTRQVGVGVCRVPTSGRKSPEMRRHQEFHREQNMATPSPVTDGRVVVVHLDS